MRARGKAAGGKVVEVEVGLQDEAIKQLRITGDFFIYPEEGIEIIEQSLQGHPDKAMTRLQDAIAEHNLELVGISAEQIIALIQEAMR